MEFKNVRKPYITTIGDKRKSIHELIIEHCGGDPWELGKDGSCVEWNGSRNPNNYGSLYISANRLKFHGYPCNNPNGIAMLTHRLVYMIDHGIIEDNSLVVMHSCDNRLCCSPYHLSLGTRKENNQDARKKGRYSLGITDWKPPAVLPEHERNYLNEEQLKHFLSKIEGGEEALLGCDCAKWKGSISKNRAPFLAMNYEGNGKKQRMVTHVVLRHYTGFEITEHTGSIIRKCGDNDCVSLACMGMTDRTMGKTKSGIITNPKILSIIDELNNMDTGFLSHESKASLEKYTEYQRFLNAIDIADNWNDCWNWKLSLNNTGYGRFNRMLDGNEQVQGEMAHRISCQTWYGEIPEGMVVRHLCHNRSCVNPKHLKIGTPQENKMDSYEDDAIETLFSIEQIKEILEYSCANGWDPNTLPPKEKRALGWKLRRELAVKYGLEYNTKISNALRNLMQDSTFMFIERPWKS